MSNPFSKGNKELLAQARRNPILSDDDLIPTTSEGLGAYFDQAYYRTGSGIDNVINDIEIERNKKISERMKQDGFSDDDINVFSSFYKPALRQDNFDFSKDMDPRVVRSKVLYDQMKDKYPDIKTDEQVRSEAKSFAMGEVQQADKIADKSDSLTLALVGGFGGVLTDPSVVGTMFIPLGQEVAIAKTGSIVSSILKRSAIEGTLGAAGEAISIPLQQRNHAFLNEDFTTWDAARNIAFAGTGGFLLTALGKSGLETFKYVKELKRGTEDARKIITNNIDNTPTNQASVKYMEDVSYTANRALEGDEFPPLHGEDITPDQYVKHMDDARIAYEEAMAWGEYNKTGNYDEVLPTVKSDVTPRVHDDDFYKDLLTESDRGYDQELFKQAEKIDVEMPIGTRTGEEGEIIIDTRTSKSLAKELDDELTALEGISMCMRGSA